MDSYGNHASRSVIFAPTCPTKGRKPEADGYIKDRPWGHSGGSKFKTIDEIKQDLSENKDQNAPERSHQEVLTSGSDFQIVVMPDGQLVSAEELHPKAAK